MGNRQGRGKGVEGRETEKDGETEGMGEEGE